MKLPFAGTNEPAPDRMGVVDHIQERGESPEHELGGSELWLSKWLSIRRKAMENKANFGVASGGIGELFQ